MNRDDIIRMAQEACGDPAWDGGVDWVWGEVERFAKLVATAERERLLSASELCRVCEQRRIRHETAAQDETNS